MPAWKKNMLELKFWDARIRKLQGKQVKTSTIKRRAKAASLWHRRNESLEVCLQERDKLYAE